MNAFTLLKADHMKVASIFEKLAATNERDVKNCHDLFANLKEELDVHARIEETFLYRALEKAEETHNLALEAVEEHAIVNQLLSELEHMEKDHAWWARLKVLRENVEHHVEEEETELFAKAGKVLSEGELESLGALMQRAKEVPKKKAA